MVLEFFAVSHLTNSINIRSEKEDKHLNKIIVENDLNDKDKLNIEILTVVLGIISLIISIFTAKLAYNCNLKASDVSRCVATLFGFFFSGSYLVYYFIWHTILGNKCY